MRITILLALLPLLGACAAISQDRLPVCDGQARRPANPHGSVLLAPPDAGAEVGPATSSPTPSPESPTGGCA